MLCVVPGSVWDSSQLSQQWVDLVTLWEVPQQSNWFCLLPQCELECVSHCLLNNLLLVDWLRKPMLAGFESRTLETPVLSVASGSVRGSLF